MPPTRRLSSTSTELPDYRWADYDDAALLNLRFSSLRLRLRNSLAWPEVQRLYSELERRGFAFRPHVWLSTEWFSPDGIPGFAIPFYLAHPRLRQLERNIMGDVEGGSRKWRLRIMRHETGHAVDNAYRLRRRADWRREFGRASAPYPDDYSPRPSSRRHVLHLGHWYAQSHPTEDFAETFAVWMQPRARWRRDYEAWPVMRKLEFVDELMGEIAGQPQLRRLLERRARLHPYFVDHAIRTVRQRARQLDLVLRSSRREAKRPVVRLHERIVLDVLQRNRENYAL